MRDSQPCKCKMHYYCTSCLPSFKETLMCKRVFRIHASLWKPHYRTRAKHLQSCEVFEEINVGLGLHDDDDTRPERQQSHPKAAGNHREPGSSKQANTHECGVCARVRGTSSDIRASATSACDDHTFADPQSSRTSTHARTYQRIGHFLLAKANRFPPL